MLRSMNDLDDCVIQATDGIIGQVKDLYFDDHAWVIRYLVVDTGTWLSSRKVLISPIAIGHPNWTEKVLPVSITKEQVKNSPAIDTDKPVSRQNEMTYSGYYGYPYYWGGAGLWGGGVYPGSGYASVGVGVGLPPVVPPEVEEANACAQAQAAARHQDDDPHLRSSEAVKGYHIRASDGDIGHVQGLLVDEETWAIRYIIVDTSNWWLGQQVLIAPRWIEGVSWSDVLTDDAEVIARRLRTLGGCHVVCSVAVLTRSRHELCKIFSGLHQVFITLHGVQLIRLAKLVGSIDDRSLNDCNPTRRLHVRSRVAIRRQSRLSILPTRYRHGCDGQQGIE